MNPILNPNLLLRTGCTLYLMYLAIIKKIKISPIFFLAFGISCFLHVGHYYKLHKNHKISYEEIFNVNNVMSTPTVFVHTINGFLNIFTFFYLIF